MKAIATPARASAAWSRLAVGLGGCAAVGTGISTARAVAESGSAAGTALAALTAMVAGAFLWGTLSYAMARVGRARREAAHRPVGQRRLNRCYDPESGPLLILVPAYREEAAVVRRTLLSAALQQYPDRRVVLLIDDSPEPTGPGDAALLDAARRLPGEVGALLAPGKAGLAPLLRRVDQELRRTDTLVGARLALSDGYRWVARWLEELAGDWPQEDHNDRLFVDLVLRRLADRHHQTARRLHRGRLGRGDLVRLARRLETQFVAEVSAFERKQFVNLSHEPNKAMNINSYLSLVDSVRVAEEVPQGTVLRSVRRGEAGHLFPDAEFVLTLDADSVLLPEYALRLIHEMTAPGNERLAVVQTPYSAVPGAPEPLERLAGATTDLQYFVHQGFTAYGATFWVGANAILRMAALREIATSTEEHGHPVTRFIQDRTVIEDTESTIDLRSAGWQLLNYPERLAYSATPQDFGSLLIQRRRWANGGMLIAPKLVRQVASGGGPRRQRVLEAFLRLHYLLSTAAVNIGLVAMLLLPLDSRIALPWLPLAAAPYFLLYARDLRLAGYHRADVLRVYALNLVLVPVNLGGVLKSLEQAVTGRKIPFARTPKVAARTPAPRLYAQVELLAVGWLLNGVLWDGMGHRWLHGTVGLVNALLLGYALVRVVGLGAIVEDAGLRRPVRRGGPRPGRLAVTSAPAV